MNVSNVILVANVILFFYLYTKFYVRITIFGTLAFSFHITFTLIYLLVFFFFL